MGPSLKFSRLPGILLLLTFSALSCPVLSQAPAPSLNQRPPVELVPRSADDRALAAKDTRHIVLYATVTNQRGSAEKGLTRQDFNILDNGKPQTIVTFQPPPSVSDPSPRVLLVLDTLNNSFENVAYERQSTGEYLKRNGSRLPLPTSLVLLSDSGAKVGKPTQDGNVLAADLKKLQTPVHMIGSAEGENGAMRRFALSVKILMQFTSYQAGLPGRAIVIWIGPGWPLLAGSEFTGTQKDRNAYWGAIVDLTNNLRRSRLTLNQISPPSLSRGTAQSRDYYRIYLSGITDPANARSGNLSLPVLALQSGGQVLDDGSSISGQIASCIADADNSYQLAFDAAPATKIDEYHAITVTVAGPGNSVRTTAAYYAQP